MPERQRNASVSATFKCVLDVTNNRAKPSTTEIKKPPHRAIKLSVSNNLIAEGGGGVDRQSVTGNN